jgi:hypothetical protein
MTRKSGRRFFEKVMPKRISMIQTRRAALERFQAKWRPVRVKKTRQFKNPEPRFDSIETEKALAQSGHRFSRTSDFVCPEIMRKTKEG